MRDEILKTILSVTGGIIIAWIGYYGQQERLRRKGIQKDGRQIAFDSTIAAYEQTIKLLEKDRDYWQDRALRKSAVE